MAVLFMDGFEGKDSANGKWDGGGISSHSSPGRFAFTGSQCGIIFSTAFARKNLPATTQLTYGFAFFCSSASTYWWQANTYSNSGGSQQTCVQVNATSGKIEVCRGASTVIATGTTVLKTGTWYYVEVQMTSNATTGTIKVRLNGSSTNEISFTGNTQGAAFSTYDTFALVGTSNNNYFDDVYIADGTGSNNNDFLGDVRCYPMLPTGAGASTTWTPSSGSNWSNVSAPAVQSTNINSTSTANNIDEYTVGSLPSGTASLLAVQGSCYASKSDAGARSIDNLIRLASTDYIGSASPHSLGGSTYTTYFDVWDKNPNTNAAWAVSDVSAAQVGVKCI